MNRIRGHLTFANAVSLIALFVALGGTSYALTLGKNTVGAKQIKKNAVRASEIRKSAVRSSEVKDASLLAGDFAVGQLPKGDKGDKGDRGADGPVGISNYELVTFGGIVPAAGTGENSFSVPCPEGKKVLGGGVATFNDNIKLKTSTPLDNPSRWAVTVKPFTAPYGGSVGGSSVNIRVVCATVEGPAP